MIFCTVTANCFLPLHLHSFLCPLKFSVASVNSPLKGAWLFLCPPTSESACLPTAHLPTSEVFFPSAPGHSLLYSLPGCHHLLTHQPSCSPRADITLGNRHTDFQHPYSLASKFPDLDPSFRITKCCLSTEILNANILVSGHNF